MSDPQNHPSRHDSTRFDPPASSDGVPPRDQIDALLREWHSRNAERAAAGRTQLMATLRAERTAPASASAATTGSSAEQRAVAVMGGGRRSVGVIHTFRRFAMHRYTRAAACLVLLAGLFALFIPFGDRSATADAGFVQVPDGGRLDAVDEKGNLVGPCPLKHTDVQVNIGAQFSRVKLKQTYSNPYPFKIEAVYTFPLSARGAVDQMSMTVGDRVVEGEVKERERARQIYEQARASGYVASLLEQERPNIFTQSVANIEPGATVVVEIAYVETLQSRDGEFRFDFPMVVGPRYIPGYPGGAPAPRPGLPVGFVPRRGVALLGPASIAMSGTDNGPQSGQSDAAAPLAADVVAARLLTAVPIDAPGEAWWASARENKIARVAEFVASYVDGAKEAGEIYSDGTGQLNGRWVWCPPAPSDPARQLPIIVSPPAQNVGQKAGDDAVAPNANPAEVQPGSGFAANTDQVPDASRITPMPTRPPTRAGHDVSIAVTIDSGGPKLLDVKSTLHEVTTLDDSGSRRTLALAKKAEIPNRDFVLSWRTDATEIAEAVLTDVDPRNGGFVTVVLNPPARNLESAVRPRELIFVLDTSGSMNGFPIEKAKAVMAKAIDAMRPGDTFNMITFAGDTHVLWPEPRQATPKNRDEAQAFLASRQGRGGTEMMKAIDAALRPAGGPNAGLAPMALANLPADGRSVTVIAPYSSIEQRGDRFVLRISDGIVVPMTMGIDLPTVLQPQGVSLRLVGAWRTVGGERVLQVNEAAFAEKAVGPMRICMFLTDGYVGNDQAIVQAIRDNAGTTRVFGFGIGNSVNRWLLEQMSLAGRGQSEFVTLAEESDKAVERFTARIQNPVLTDIAVRFEGVAVGDVVPGSPSTAPGLLPDLYDVEPLVLHARYQPVAGASGAGTMIVTGNSGSGPWEKRVALTLPQERAVFQVLLGDQKVDVALGNDALPVLWARSKVEQVLAPHLQAVQEGNLDPATRRDVVALGERFSILTPYTSFVAVEKARVTLGGRPTLVPVPIELPEGLRWEGFFDENRRPLVAWREALLSNDDADDEQGEKLYLGVAVKPSEGAPIAAGESQAKADGAKHRSLADTKGFAGGENERQRLTNGVLASPGSPASIAPTPPAPKPAAPPPPPPSQAPGAAPAPTGQPAPTPTLAKIPTDKGLTTFSLSAAGSPAEPSGLVGGAAGDTRTAGQRRGQIVPQDPTAAPTVGGIAIRERQSGAATADAAGGFAPRSKANEVLSRGGSAGLGLGGGGGGGSVRDFAGAPEFNLADALLVGTNAVQPQDRALFVGNAVMALVKPELWTVNGGTLLAGRVDQGMFLIEPAAAAVLDADTTKVLEQAIVTRDVLMKSTAPLDRAEAAKTAVVPSTPIAAVPANDHGATLVIYDVRDLLAMPDGGTDSSIRVADLLQEFVWPDRWVANGGAEARPVGTVLAIRATPEHHGRIAALLNAMRGVRSSGGAARLREGALLVYDCTDLSDGSGQVVDQIEKALMLIDPPSWIINDGDGARFGAVAGVLVVKQSPANLDAVETLLDQIHVALGKTLPDARRSSAEAAQKLPLPDGATRLIAHPIDDLVARVSRDGQIDRRSAALRVATNAVRAAATGLATESKSDPNTVAESLAKRTTLPAETLLIEGTVEEHVQLDETLQTMRDAFSLPHRQVQRTAEAIAALEAASADAARAAAALAQRKQRVDLLHRRLDAPLFARVIEFEDPTGSLVDRQKVAELLGGRDAAAGDSAIAVSVLVDDVLPARLAALRKAGLSIEGQNDRLKVVAGWAPPEKLAAIALTEGVRRVEIAR